MPVFQIGGIEDQFEYAECTLQQLHNGIKCQCSVCGSGKQHPCVAECCGQKKSHEQKQNPRTCKHGRNADEEIADAVPQIFRVVGMLHESQCARTPVDAEQFDLFDLMTEKKAHGGMGEFMHGGADDPRIVDDGGTVFAAGTHKQLLAGMDEKSCRHDTSDGGQKLCQVDENKLFHCCVFCGGWCAACCAA